MICSMAISRADFVLNSNSPSGGAVTAGTGGYTTTGSTRSGSAGGGPPAGAGCSGTLSWQWAWTGPNPAPPYVIFTITASATASGMGGQVSDGFGDPISCPFPFSVTSSSGTHYILQAVSGTTLSYSVPNVSFSVPSGGGGVNVTVTPTPISIDLGGAVLSGTSYVAAVGQHVTANVNGMGGKDDTYTWSAPSGCNPIGGYSPSASGCASPSDVSLPPANSSNMDCYFGTTGTATFNCTYYSKTANISVSLTKAVIIQGLTRSQVYHSIGSMQLRGTPPSAFDLWGVIILSTSGGVYQIDTLQDPACVTSGSGQWGYVQTLNATYTINGSPTVKTGLDGGLFPYTDSLRGSTWTSADGGTMRAFRDAPGFNPMAPGPFPFRWVSMAHSISGHSTWHHPTVLARLSMSQSVFRFGMPKDNVLRAKAADLGSSPTLAPVGAPLRTILRLRRGPLGRR